MRGLVHTGSLSGVKKGNSVGVLLGVKKGLELCGSSSWSEEGPRIVREFFLA